MRLVSSEEPVCEFLIMYCPSLVAIELLLSIGLKRSGSSSNRDAICVDVRLCGKLLLGQYSIIVGAAAILLEHCWLPV